MTADTTRPSTRLSSREPPRKRRRAPPPLSVTNVFADARLPDSAEKLWKWPVTSWYFGDVGDADSHITSDRPFVKHVANLPPLEKHYRLRWLEEDAAKFVLGEQPTLPEPLPVIPYARQKNNTACARPSKGLGTGVDRNAPGRPRKRKGAPTEAPVVEAATIDVSDEGALQKGAFAADSSPSQLLGTPGAHLIPKVSAKAEPSNVVAKSEPFSVVNQPPKVMQTEANKSPILNHCIELPSVQSPSVSSPSETIVCDTPINTSPAPSPSIQSSPQRKENLKECTPSENIQDDHKPLGDDEQGVGSGEDVLLQFLSPVEPRLMGTLTYSLPINATPEKDEKEVIVDELPPAQKHRVFDADGICVNGLDLEFRKSARPFEDAFHDVETSDDLRPEILRLNTLLNGLGPKTKPLRNMIYAVLRSEIQRQKKRDEGEAEEARIIERLKQIEKEKAAGKAAEKAAQRASLAKARAAARCASASAVVQGRRRRPSRKIKEEPDSDEEVLQVVNIDKSSKPMSIGATPDLRNEQEASNCHSPLKLDGTAELVDLTSPVSNARASLMTCSTPTTQAKFVKGLRETLASEKAENMTADDGERGTLLISAKTDIITSEPNPLARANGEDRDPGGRSSVHVTGDKKPMIIQGVTREAPAPASAVVSPDCVTQLGIVQMRDESSKRDMSPLELVSSTSASTSAVREQERVALSELTNVHLKSPEKELSTEPSSVIDASGLGPGSCRTDEGTENPLHELRQELSPLEEARELTTTPITEIDMDGSLDSDDESKPKDISESSKSQCKKEQQGDFENLAGSDPTSKPTGFFKEESPDYNEFLKEGKVTDQLVRMPSPVSPLQAATPTCGFVVVPPCGPTKVLTSGSALVNHMKAMQDGDTKQDSSPHDS